MADRVWEQESRGIGPAMKLQEVSHPIDAENSASECREGSAAAEHALSGYAPHTPELRRPVLPTLAARRAEHPGRFGLDSRKDGRKLVSYLIW